MFDKISIGLGIFLLAILLSRILREKALKLLDQEQKVALLDTFSGTRAYGLIPVVVLAAAFFVVIEFSGMDPTMVFYVYIGLLALLMIVAQFFSYKKMSRLDLPKKYYHLHGIARAVSYLGVGALFFVLFQTTI